jgi:coproporphyrinogen III oxidase-like Fe-S oxidoreductase
MTALYIHWPFCKAKCPYCDFNSHVRDGVDAARWQSAMLAELRTMAAWMPDARLSSIFFGGGTPSLMPPQLVEALIERAEALLGFEDGIEITL